jgi:hypothetical protein
MAAGLNRQPESSYVILFSQKTDGIGQSTGAIQSRERLGGMLKFYHRQAA